VTSGIRIGTAAITTRGFKGADCIQTVNWIDQVIQNVDAASTIEAVKMEINAYMEQFPLYSKALVG
ncbi:MAG: serine hydroxymethyltransferase, partial [Bacteroidota bacterium]